MANASELKTIKRIHDALDSKETSVLELTKSYLAAAKASDHNAYLHLCEKRALEQAVSCDAILKSNGKVPRTEKPLFGVPMGIKDILHVEGAPTTCASKMLEGYQPPFSATVVNRLEKSGAVTLGKLNMDEFAMGGSNENSAFGPVKHPTHKDRVPGGSSGGSATAVRAGLCAAALGTDTGGSIRLPASYCGIVGLKPTYGRVSRYGVVAFSSSLDQVGPMSVNVEDSARVLQAMGGHDPRDSTSSARPLEDFVGAANRDPDFSKLRVGVPKEYFASGGVSSTVKASVEGAIEFYRKKGARLVEVSLPHSPYSVAVYYVIAVSEASSNLSRFDGVHYGVRSKAASEAESAEAFYAKARALFGPEVKRRIILGTFALSSGYYDAYFQKACRVRALIQRDFAQAFQQCDVIAGPVSTGTAFKMGDHERDPLAMYLNDLYTIPANLAGLPAMSIPCSEDESGLPIGLHLIGPRFSETTLFSVAGAFERGRA